MFSSGFSSERGEPKCSVGRLASYFQPEGRVNSRHEEWELKLLWTSELRFNEIFQVAKE